MPHDKRVLKDRQLTAAAEFFGRAAAQQQQQQAEQDASAFADAERELEHVVQILRSRRPRNGQKHARYSRISRAIEELRRLRNKSTNFQPQIPRSFTENKR